jgi:intron-binding protein aquarius
VTVDFCDTFLDLAHARESFPGREVVLPEGIAEADAVPPFKVQFPMVRSSLLLLRLQFPHMRPTPYGYLEIACASSPFPPLPLVLSTHPFPHYAVR